MRYYFTGQNSGTFSRLNTNTAVWSFTASSNDLLNTNLSVPILEIKGNPVSFQGVAFASASVGNFYCNGGFNSGGGIFYDSKRGNTTNLVSGSNYQITEINTTQTVLLPSNPKVGDYVWYENHNTVTGRLTITVDGNGNSIRDTTNNIVNTTTTQGLFHFDGTYWNNIYIA